MKGILMLLLVAGLAASPSPALAGPAISHDGIDVGCSGEAEPLRSRFTPDQLANEGREYFEWLVASHGQSPREDWRNAVESILDRLAQAARHPGLDMTFAVIDEDEQNAMVLPGDYVVVYSGLLESFEQAAAERFPADRASADRAFNGMLAGVLAHEVAHLTLGHPGSLVALHLGETYAAADALHEREFVLDRRVVDQRAYGRDCETDADRTGAFYLQRAGWDIQDMIEVFRNFNDTMARDEGHAHLSYLSSHPHPADREADLEVYRGELRRHQRRFDDALTLVRNNVELDHAIELLDQVLADFPDLLAARHARATAFHRKWLNEVPVQLQRFRPSLLTISANFLPGIRGGTLIAPELLEEAAAEYDRILADRILPQTLSNRALVHAYFGEHADAVRLARQASGLVPGDVALGNNLGVVLFLSGSHNEAIALFRELAGSTITAENASAALNLGLALAEIGDDSASAALAAYLEADGDSAWSQYVRHRLGPAGADAPVRTASASITGAPSLAGLTLGSAHTAVLERLGQPEDGEGLVWEYPSRGITIGFTRAGAVTALAALAPEAGTIEGLRVGDSQEQLVERWGQPNERERDEWSEVWWYVFDGWFLIAEFDGGAIDGMGVIATQQP